MPRTAHKVTRLHLSLFDSKVDALRLIAKDNKITLSGLIRIILEGFVDNHPTVQARLNSFESEQHLKEELKSKEIPEPKEILKPKPISEVVLNF